jgi:peptide/nickel transport system ATP-binding protein
MTEAGGRDGSRREEPANGVLHQFGAVSGGRRRLVHVRRGETWRSSAKSGCGKSVSALSIMRLVPDPPGRIVGGSVTLEGTDLLGVSDAEMRKIRGNRISMIFQEPMTSLNPVMRIGDQITEVVRCTGR